MRVKHSEGVWRKRWTLLPSLADSGIVTLNPHNVITHKWIIPYSVMTGR
jgi:hypothetical protein